MTYRPTTPAEALAYVEHASMTPGHTPCPGCCSFWEMELYHAEETIAALQVIDWLPPRPAQSLPTSVPAGDPKKSAARILDLSDRTFAVWQMVAAKGGYGMTSVELNDHYAAMSADHPNIYPPMKHDSPRKRLVELERAGHLVKTSEVRGGAAVWRAASRGVHEFSVAS